MATVSGTYLGGLRVEATHEGSGTRLVSDAPLDNGGQASSFSPTDLCATSLALCALTIMGKYADAHNLNIDGTSFSVNKVMASAPPRRIARIEVSFTFPPRAYTDKQKKGLQAAARTCPVHLSLHPEIEQVISFNWVD